MEDEDHLPSRDALDPPWAFRGHDLSRTLALSDGIFAFAATLLVLDLTLPVPFDSAVLEPYLTGSKFLGAALAYGITFFVITLWWMGHHLIFGYLRRFDRVLIRLNTVFLLFIAILPFTTLVLTQTSSNPAGVCFFAGVQIAAGSVLGAIWLYAAGPGKLVADGFSPAWKSYVTRHTFTTPVAFAISIPIALVNASYGEYSWLLIFALPLFWRRRTGQP